MRTITLQIGQEKPVTQLEKMQAQAYMQLLAKYMNLHKLNKKIKKAVRSANTNMSETAVAPTHHELLGLAVKEI